MAAKILFKVQALNEVVNNGEAVLLVRKELDPQEWFDDFIGLALTVKYLEDDILVFGAAVESVKGLEHGKAKTKAKVEIEVITDARSVVSSGLYGPHNAADILVKSYFIRRVCDE